MLLGTDSASERAVRSAVKENVLHDVLVGESRDIVEVALRILRITAGMRSADHRNRAACAKPIAQRVRQLSRFAVGADEHEVNVRGKLVCEVFKAGIAQVRDLVPPLGTPNGSDLRHDADRKST